MKYLFIVIFFCVHHSGKACCYNINPHTIYTPWTDTVSYYDKLTSIKYRKYLHRKIGNLLTKIEIKPTWIYYATMRPRVLAFVTIQYGDSLWLDIYVSEFKYLNPVLEETETKDVWTEENLRNETVSKLRLRTPSRVIKEFPRKPKLPAIK